MTSAFIFYIFHGKSGYFLVQKWWPKFHKKIRNPGPAPLKSENSLKLFFGSFPLTKYQHLLFSCWQKINLIITLWPVRQLEAPYSSVDSSPFLVNWNFSVKIVFLNKIFFPQIQSIFLILCVVPRQILLKLIRSQINFDFKGIFLFLNSSLLTGALEKGLRYS